MCKLVRIALILMLSPLAWAQACETPKNFAALVELIADVGEPSEFGSTLTENGRPEKYYATLIRGEFPELLLIREKWTKKGQKNRIDQWVLKYTVNGTFVWHKELREKGQRVVQPLSTKGADVVGCQIFSAFLGSTKSKMKASRS